MSSVSKQQELGFKPRRDLHCSFHCMTHDGATLSLIPKATNSCTGALNYMWPIGTNITYSWSIACWKLRRTFWLDTTGSPVAHKGSKSPGSRQSSSLVSGPGAPTPGRPTPAHTGWGGTRWNREALWSSVSSRANGELDDAFSSQVMLFMTLSPKIFTAFSNPVKISSCYFCPFQFILKRSLKLLELRCCFSFPFSNCTYSSKPTSSPFFPMSCSCLLKKSPTTSLKFFLYLQYTPSCPEFNETLCANGSYCNWHPASHIISPAYHLKF